MSSFKFVVTDYWSGDHRPYRSILHTVRGDIALDAHETLAKVIEAAGAVDGDEIEITIKPTGRRPFGDRRVRLVKPHIYDREK